MKVKGNIFIPMQIPLSPNTPMRNLFNLSVQTNKLLFFVLVDPDKFSEQWFEGILSQAKIDRVNAFLIGGSFLKNHDITEVTLHIKQKTGKTVCLFPGNFSQLSEFADSILFLSLISGRNPDFLIGQHVIAAPILEKYKLEVIPTGYILINTGSYPSVHYVSQTIPIPSDKEDLVVYTALAGQFLGLQCIYLEAGSGSKTPVPYTLVEKVAKKISIPIIIGGGIKDAQTIMNLYNSGANAIVVSSLIEKNPDEIDKLTI